MMIGEFRDPGENTYYVESNKTFLSDYFYHEGGAIHWLTTVKDSSVSAEVMISDCDKRIYLDFDWSTEEDYQARLEKLDCLLEQLKLFKKSLKSSKARREEVTKLVKEAGKEERKDAHILDDLLCMYTRRTGSAFYH